MTQSRMAQVEVALDWRSPHARHRDRLLIDKLNFWRDFLPADMGERLAQAQPAVPISAEIALADWFESYQAQQVKTIRPEQFNRRLHADFEVIPRRGRFYPRSFVSGVAEITSGDRRPLRCLETGEQQLQIDLNHPLAGKTAVFESRTIAELPGRAERGGLAHDVVYSAGQSGPGMQAALPDQDTAFFVTGAFDRLDTRLDSEFYAQARLVQHIDSTAQQHLRELYARLLQPGMRVLDLMTSWESHLPWQAGELDVVGLGMNQAELQANPQLCEFRLHDLNAVSELPFADRGFDAAVCSLSVEYLTAPLAVFKDVARVLKPGAPFVVSFSERFFPTKVIQLWQELHPFERLGLVSDYFRFAGGFENLHTESVRGYPRPQTDAYADRLSQSDAIYAVWGQRG